MANAYTWDELASATLGRQFPRIRGRGTPAVVELVRRVGPIQSQVARAPFLTVASRLPGASYEAINQAHESLELLRGTNLRGTVHTCVREQHEILDVISRRTLENLWRRSLKLTKVSVDEVRDEMERFAAGAWRTPEQLRAHLTGWLTEHEAEGSAAASDTVAVGRAMAHGHSALVRRPLNGGAWDRQTTPGYRSAPELLGVGRQARLADPDGALVDLTRIHLAAFGPASRADVAWWTAEGLRRVDAALQSLREELTTRPGPQGLTYYDLADAPKGGVSSPGVRLLPPYDGLLLGYAPAARDRFLDPGNLKYFWNTENAAFSAVVFDGRRLSASWGLLGSGRSRTVELRCFPGLGRVDEADLAEPVRAVEAALDIEVKDVRVSMIG